MDSFRQAQAAALSSHKAIKLPRPDDQLWIVTDGSVKKHGIGATLYITRNGKQHLAGFFSAKLRGRQVSWLPCEVEALSIAVATKHFHPYIVQSQLRTCVLTDSKPCVQSYEKLCRGEFSASPRVSTFLSTVSRYNVSVRHLAGSANVPSDFASRNASDCDNVSCQVCSFVQHLESCVVNLASVNDIITGATKLPFTNRAPWHALQSECPDLRRTHAHLKQGTRPSKRLTDVKDVKRYLNSVTIAKDGLLVVHRQDPLSPSRECIVVPRQVLDGLVVALHIRLDHPSCHQLKLVMRWYFFALDMDHAVDIATSSCHQCASLKKIPHHRVSQTTGDPPEKVDISFATDILKRERQLILVLRECVTSFTAITLVSDERRDSLRDALLRLCLDMCPMDGPPAVIRTDNAPGFQSLQNDPLLRRYKISIELARAKNLNKNPAAERAIQELQTELLRQDSLGDIVSPLSLSIATARLNSRIRTRGLSSREMWVQRDQFTNTQIPLTDRDLIMDQHAQRTLNHRLSEQSKAPNCPLPSNPSIAVGDLVYLHTDGNKGRARNRYLVVTIEDGWCNLRKFTGSQLRKTSYRVRTSECYKVPSSEELPSPYPLKGSAYESSDDEEVTVPTRVDPPPLPAIPPLLSSPAGPHPGSPSVTASIEPTEESSTHPASPDNRDRQNPPDDVPHDSNLRRSGRHRSLPKHFNDYVLD